MWRTLRARAVPEETGRVLKSKCSIYQEIIWIQEKRKIKNEWISCREMTAES
jgi:hypothetical protein